MRRSNTLTLLTVAAVCSIHAQTATHAPHFDVASVKENRGDTSSVRIENGEHVVYTRIALGSLIARAFKAELYQVKGLPSNAIKTYDVAAVMPAGTTVADIPAMLRSLLVERFGLEAREVVQPEPAYALTVKPGGSKLKPCETDACPTYVLAEYPITGMFVMLGHNLSDVVRALSSMMDRPAVDMTGETGTFDITLIAQGSLIIPSASSNDGEHPGGFKDISIQGRTIHLPTGLAPPVSAALGDLGLSLDKRVLELRHIVVDRVNIDPTAN